MIFNFWLICNKYLSLVFRELSILLNGGESVALVDIKVPSDPCLFTAHCEGTSKAVFVFFCNL
jgi:hypothetical protein